MELAFLSMDLTLKKTTRLASRQTIENQPYLVDENAEILRRSGRQILAFKILRQWNRSKELDRLHKLFFGLLHFLIKRNFCFGIDPVVKSKFKNFDP